MGKPAKKEKPVKAKATTKKLPKDKPVAKEVKEGYGVDYLAEQLGLEPFTVRQKLRKAKVEKAGRSYTWATKKEADDVAKTLKATKLKGEE